jgi:membrane protein YdbS with pleckstrin-like domain
MAVTAPIDIPTPRRITEEVRASEIVVRGDDLKQVRLYCRLAAAIPAVAVILLALVVSRITIPIVDWRVDPGQTRVLLAAAVVLSGVQYLRAELRLRSYRLDLTSDAVIFEYGRRRSYVPREHVQLFDTESSILLKIFGLRRCNLHTGGGTVVVSPAPARVASAIERMIYEQPATMRADRPDADA